MMKQSCEMYTDSPKCVHAIYNAVYFVPTLHFLWNKLTHRFAPHLSFLCFILSLKPLCRRSVAPRPCGAHGRLARVHVAVARRRFTLVTLL